MKYQLILADRTNGRTLALMLMLRRSVCRLWRMYILDKKARPRAKVTIDSPQEVVHEKSISTKMIDKQGKQVDFELAIAHPPPRGNFRHYYFLIAQCLLNIFYLFYNLATGAFGSYKGQRSSSALSQIVYCWTAIYVAFSCHFLNLVGQIIFLIVQYIHMYRHNKFLPK